MVYRYYNLLIEKVGHCLMLQNNQNTIIKQTMKLLVKKVKRFNNLEEQNLFAQ